MTQHGAAPDRIRLTGLVARGHHGVFAHEKRDGQEFVVDLELGLDLSVAGASDDLAATVDYGALAEAVVARISGPAFDLIERLAEVVAQDALAHDRVDEVTVTVHKPQAPIEAEFGDVAVVVHRSRASVPVVIALGGNLGEVGVVLDEVTMTLAEGVLTDVTSSGRYVTDPVGGPDQPDYENRVLVARTRLSASSLLRRLHGIEADHGRERAVRWGARTLDLDLISYGSPGGDDEVVSERPELTLPHPRAGERAFVLVPWLDADPAARLRVGSQVVAVADLLDQVDTSGVQRIEYDT
ncbi:MAG: dihydroneopterin aldolase [Phycicoccus sp.]|nr:dihydroneopterin aldolase [Phycicoccus sp.]